MVGDIARKRLKALSRYSHCLQSFVAAGGVWDFNNSLISKRAGSIQASFPSYGINLVVKFKQSLKCPLPFIPLVYTK